MDKTPAGRSAARGSLGRTAALLLLAGALIAAARPGGGTAPDLDTIHRLNRDGRFADAERGARARLAELARRDGTDSMRVAEVLDELATALRRGGKGGQAEAREVCARSLRIREAAGRTRDAGYATSLYNIGLLHYVKGEYDSAGVPLLRALEIREEVLGPVHPDVAQSLTATGALALERGDYDRAHADLERAVRIQRTSLPPGDTDRAYPLIALGSLEYETGALAGCIPPLEEATALLERAPSPNRPLLGNCYHNLGCAYAEMDDRGKALPTLRSALRLREASLGRDHPIVASTLIALGAQQALLPDSAAARASYERALRILERAYGSDSPDVAWAQMKLGRFCLASGDLPRARTLLRDALATQERTLGAESATLWQTLTGLAEVARAEGDSAAARGLYERTLRILEGAFGPSNIDVGGTLQDYARFLLAAGDSAAALDVSVRAARVNGEQLRLISRGLSERQALGYASSLGPSLDVALAVLAGDRFRDDPARVREVWDALVHWRALILDEVASRNRSVEGSDALLEPAARLDSARQELANLLVRGPGELPLDRYRRLTDAARDRVERAERDLGHASATYRSEQAQRRTGLQEIGAALPDSSALLAFAEYGAAAGRAYMAFALSRDGEPAAVPLGPASIVDDLVSSWARTLGAVPGEAADAGRDAESACRAAGTRLRARVWDPVAAGLGSSRRVFVVLDGSLHLVNFAALPVGASGYLVETGPLLHHLSAERDLTRPEAPGRGGEGLLAMGGPAFDARPGRAAAAPPGTAPSVEASTNRGAERAIHGATPGCVEFRTLRFGPLPESVREVKEIASDWPDSGGTLVLTGPDATERAFKALAPGRSVLHVATHAFFLSGRCSKAARPGPGATRGIGGLVTATSQTSARAAVENPLRLSGIALAGANLRGSVAPEEEDGVVTAEEIASLDLSRVRIAVLSACDTGAGEIQAGEGVLGLRRAFECAGVATLIMSLWSVEDRSARQWMQAFYDARFRGHRETDEAVRDASLGVLRERRAQGRGTHPFHWAAFVAAGDWR